MMEEKEKNSHARSNKVKAIIAVSIIVSIAIVISLIVWYVRVYQQQIISISADYNGATTAGTVLDDNNTDIIVTGMKRNGDTMILSQEDWTVRSPKTLEPDITTKIMIMHNNTACYLEIDCTDSTVEGLVVEYIGSTDAGTVIDIGTEGLIITATRKNGSAEDVTQECVMKNGPVTLEPNKTSVIAVSYTDELTGDIVNAQTSVTCTSRTVRNITVKYEGPAEAGEVIDSNNPHFVVMATYDTGEIEEVDDWIVKNPLILDINQTVDIEVEYEGQTGKVTIKCSTVDEEAFKESCKEVSYQDLMRSPDSYINQPIKVSGIVRDVESHAKTTSGYSYRVDIGKYDNARILYNGEVEAENIIEDDHIICWGLFLGIDDSFSTEMPLINGYYMEREY